MSFNSMGFEVAQLVAPLITAPAVSTALTVGATSYLVSTGEIGAAALVDLVELPAAFEIVIGAAAGAAAIGLFWGSGRQKVQSSVTNCVRLSGKGLRVTKVWTIVTHRAMKQDAEGRLLSETTGPLWHG
ncbi:MAG TPA: hypothetical protein VE685_06905 [Thermoanaerobaculia bacterium]|nr:hypothetical protein [Thermoanaerobaculia bacterium]